jgi:putative transposase
VKYAFLLQQRDAHDVKTLCRVLRASRSGYYTWCQQGPSARQQADEKLLPEIQRVHQAHRGHSGAVKTWRVLNLQGVACGKHRVARLRRQNDILARRRRRFIVTTQSRHTTWQAPNLLQRCFVTEHPDRVWAGDVKHIETREGWLFLAILLDLYSKQVVGWSMRHRNDAQLVLGALNMAALRRRPAGGLIHHSDRGRTYAGQTYQARLRALRITPSMSRKGDCWDNAVAESFFATLELELIENQAFPTRLAAKTAIFEFIEVFYNRQRAHQSLAYRTPLQVEQQYRTGS